MICFDRTITRDTELGGQQLHAGDRIGIFYPSGNRDHTVFEDPFRFDIRRSPNPHLSFGGGGPHFCLGASLARSQTLRRADADYPAGNTVSGDALRRRHGLL